METQITRIGDFLGAPRVQVRQTPPPPPRPKTPVRHEELFDEMIDQEHQVVELIPRVAQRPPFMLVNRNQDPDYVVRHVRQDAMAGELNLEAIVEQIMVRNGVNPGLQRIMYSPSLPDFVLQTELPRGWKVPKVTKFVGDTEECNVKHVSRYQTEAGDIVNNEDLKMKYFPSSLTNNEFTWLR